MTIEQTNQLFDIRKKIGPTSWGQFLAGLASVFCYRVSDYNRRTFEKVWKNLSDQEINLVTIYVKQLMFDNKVVREDAVNSWTAGAASKYVYDLESAIDKLYQT